MPENSTTAETHPRVAQTFKWPSGPCTVNIGGDFDLEGIPNWLQMPLDWTEDTCCFQKTFYLAAPREFSFKFIVDGNWVCHQGMETRTDSSGNVNNFLSLDLPPQKETVEEFCTQEKEDIVTEKSEEETHNTEIHIKKINDQPSESQVSTPTPEADVISSPSEIELSEPGDLTPLVSPTSNPVYDEMIIDTHGGDCDQSSIKTANNDCQVSDFSSIEESAGGVSQTKDSNSGVYVPVEPSSALSEVMISQEAVNDAGFGDAATKDKICSELEPVDDSSAYTNQNAINENTLEISSSEVAPCKSDAPLSEITTEDNVQKDHYEELNDESSKITSEPKPSINSSLKIEKGLDSNAFQSEDVIHDEPTVNSCGTTSIQPSPQVSQLFSEVLKPGPNTEHQAYLVEPLSEPSRHSYGLGLVSDASLEHTKISSESILSAESDCTCESDTFESGSVAGVPRSISALATPKTEAKPTTSKSDEGVCLDDSASTSPRLCDEGLADSSCMSASAISPKVASLTRTLTREQAAPKEVAETEPRGDTSDARVAHERSEVSRSVSAKKQISSTQQKEPRHKVLFILALKYFFFGFVALSGILIKMSATSLACKASYVFYKLTGKEFKAPQCKTSPVNVYALNFLEIVLGASLVATGIVVGLVVSVMKPRPCS